MLRNRLQRMVRKGYPLIWEGGVSAKPTSGKGPAKSLSKARGPVPYPARA